MRVRSTGPMRECRWRLKSSCYTEQQQFAALRDPPMSRLKTPGAASPDQAPLLRALLSEATRRQWTLARLAKAINISYERLSQYRRGHAEIAKASRPTLEAAAELLGVPLAAVFVLAGTLSPQDFVWPSQASLQERVRQELSRLQADPLFAGYADDELLRADLRVQLLVAVLYREVSGTSSRTSRLPELMRALQLATVANAEAEFALAGLRSANLAEGGAL